MSVSIQQYEASFNRVVDKLFNDLVSSEAPNAEYFQAKIDLIVEKFTHDVGHYVYKLYICQALVFYCQQEYIEALKALDQGDEVRAGKAIHRDYERIKSHIIAESNSILGKVQGMLEYQAETGEIGKSAIKAFAWSAGCFALGGTITSVSYSSAEPGETYAVTTGLFLIGGAYICAGIYRTIRWIGRR